jgi:Protein of unknown function (DUF3592)
MIASTMLRQISQTMGWPFTLVYIVLIVSALYFTFVVAPKALNANDWPSTQGEVTQSELIERKRLNKNSDIVTVYSAKIQYQYVVNDKTYSGTQLRWADRNQNRIELQMVKEYPTAAITTVFYNPQNPEEAVLQKGLSLAHILIGFFLLLSISSMAWALYRNASKRRSVFGS